MHPVLPYVQVNATGSLEFGGQESELRIHGKKSRNEEAAHMESEMSMYKK